MRPLCRVTSHPRTSAARGLYIPGLGKAAKRDTSELLPNRKSGIRHSALGSQLRPQQNTTRITRGPRQTSVSRLLGWLHGRARITRTRKSGIRHSAISYRQATPTTNNQLRRTKQERPEPKISGEHGGPILELPCLPWLPCSHPSNRNTGACWGPRCSPCQVFSLVFLC